MNASLWRWPALTAAFLLLALALQWRNGAWEAELAGHPDEAAHFVTTLMVRDYLAAGQPGPPWPYAQRYYAHYPKVALGHYPPGLYLVGALWTLLFPPAPGSLLALMALFTALTAVLLGCFLQRQVSRPAAWFAAALVVLLPAMQRYTAIIMADTLMALLALAATLCWVRYLEVGGWRWATAFGVLSGLAILTKSSGLWLAGVPVLSLLCTRRWALLRAPTFWWAAGLAGLLAAPWTFYTWRLTAEGMAYSPGAAYLHAALPYFSGELLRALGALLLVLALLGLVQRVLHPFLARQVVPSGWAAMAALAVSVPGLHLLIPSGLEERYLLPSIPPWLALAAAGTGAVAQWFPRRQTLAATVILAVAAIPCWVYMRSPLKECTGYRPIAQAVVLQPPSAHILIVSDAAGEGAFIAEVAAAEPRPTHRVQRGSKLLAQSDWMGRGYTPAYPTTAALLAGLDQAQVRHIVMDDLGSLSSVPAHQQQLTAALAGAAAQWQMVQSVPLQRRGGGGTVRHFQRREAP